jgi:hypothetical protein
MINTISRWIANFLLIVGSIALLSPVVASTAVTPWIAFTFANIAYLYNSIITKDRPLMWLCIFYASWDILLIVARYTNSNVFDILTPLVHLLEKLP